MSGWRGGAAGAAKLAAPGRFDLVSGGSGCWSVLVDEPVTGGGPSDRVVEFDHGRVVFIGWCSLIEAAVGPVRVVMGHEIFEEPV